MEIIVAEENIGSAEAGAALARRTSPPLFDSGLSFFENAFTVMAGWGPVDVDDNNDYSAFANVFSAAKDEADTWSRADRRGKWGRAEMSELTDRALTAAHAPAPSLPPADADGWTRSEALQGKNEDEPRPQATGFIEFVGMRGK